MTIGVPIVTCLSRLYQPCTKSAPIVKTVKNSQKTVKTAKMTIGVPIVTCLPRHVGTPNNVYQDMLVHQQCTNRQNSQKQSKDSQNSKNHCCCTIRHMSTQSPPNTQSPAAASSTLEEWTHTFSRGQQCTVVLELPYSTEFVRGCAAI